MGSAENKRLVIVGLFIFLSIVIFISGVFLLGGQQKRFVRSVTLKAVFEDVAGLKPGNNVWFSGVKIGTIKSINFYGNSQVEIDMNIEEKAQQYIRRDAKARISSESLIGNKIIVIFGGSNEVPPVQDGDRLEAENPLDTDDLVAKLQENNRNLVDITSDFKVLSNRLVKGEGTVGALLADSVMAQHFRDVVTNLKQASATTVRASGALAQFSNKLNNKEGLANQLLTDTIVFNKLTKSVAELEKTTASTAEFTNNLNAVSAKLNNTNNTVGVLLNDEKVAGQLKTMMGNLATGSEQLNENLEALKNNFLLKGYFKRQAKKAAKNEVKQQQKNNNNE
ncbi:MlaD family protein [Adhaeribacter aquaticus]|uniref:MlaD family protein n=1 Tax=Adhaeribacter aquaticus TaxID=299567 RepID=UPI00040726E0|nr:MlaD family protein [Adhaeribacter aquaticus]